MTSLSVFAKTAMGIGTFLLSIASSSWAANTEKTAAERCLTVATIKRTKVVDDQNILFYTRNHKIYNNHLRQACAGLTAANTFKYETAQSQLCNVDIITVLHPISGGYMPGAACGLGSFEPTADPDAKQKI